MALSLPTASSSASAMAAVDRHQRRHCRNRSCARPPSSPCPRGWRRARRPFRSAGRSRSGLGVRKPITTTAAPSVSFWRAATSDVGLDQRRVGEHHQHVVIAARDRRAGRKHGMRRCRAARPARSSRPWRQAGPPPCERLPRRGRPPARYRPPPAAAAAARHMRDHRQAGDRVQHLRQRALHARALAGGKDDRQAGSWVMAAIPEWQRMWNCGASVSSAR